MEFFNTHVWLQQQIRSQSLAQTVWKGSKKVSRSVSKPATSFGTKCAGRVRDAPIILFSEFFSWQSLVGSSSSRIRRRADKRSAACDAWHAGRDSDLNRRSPSQGTRSQAGVTHAHRCRRGSPVCWWQNLSGSVTEFADCLQSNTARNANICGVRGYRNGN